MKLRALVGFGDHMDAEVWRLNGRKGQPGEAWDQRDVLGPSRWHAPGRQYKAARFDTTQVGEGDGKIDTAPATPEAERWQGWGTALKPAWEPVVVARKPLAGTVAQNVLAYGTGALNIDATRIGTENTLSAADRQPARKWAGGVMPMAEPTGSPSGRWPANVVLVHVGPDENGEGGCQPIGVRKVRGSNVPGPNGAHGRFGNNGVYGAGAGRHGEIPLYNDPDGTETITDWACVEGCPVALLDQQSGESRDGTYVGRNRQGMTPRSVYGALGVDPVDRTYGGQGGASRFYATFQDEAVHDPGCRPIEPPPEAWKCVEGCPVALLDQQSGNVGGKWGQSGNVTTDPARPGWGMRRLSSAGEQFMGEQGGASRFYYTAKADRNERVTIDGDSHPTVKPLNLVRWLVRLVTPPGGICLDMFGGSGTTGEAAMLEGFTALVIDKDPASCAKAKVRAHPYIRRRQVITGPLVGPEQGSLL